MGIGLSPPLIFLKATVIAHKTFSEMGPYKNVRKMITKIYPNGSDEVTEIDASIIILIEVSKQSFCLTNREAWKEFTIFQSPFEIIKSDRSFAARLAHCQENSAELSDSPRSKFFA